MKKKLLVGAAIILGIVALAFMVTTVAVVLVVVWGYLIWMVRKKKTNIFHDQMEPKLAERRYKMLKTFLLVAGISFAVGIVGTIGHNVLYGLTNVEEPIFFTIALVGLYVFVIATVGGLVIFLKGRREWAREIWERLAK